MWLAKFYFPKPLLFFVQHFFYERTSCIKLHEHSNFKSFVSKNWIWFSWRENFTYMLVIKWYSSLQKSPLEQGCITEMLRVKYHVQNLPLGQGFVCGGYIRWDYHWHMFPIWSIKMATVYGCPHHMLGRRRQGLSICFGKAFLSPISQNIFFVRYADYNRILQGFCRIFFKHGRQSNVSLQGSPTHTLFLPCLVNGVKDSSSKLWFRTEKECLI